MEDAQCLEDLKKKTLIFGLQNGVNPKDFRRTGEHILIVER